METLLDYLTVTAANLEAMNQDGPAADAKACREAVVTIITLRDTLAERTAYAEELRGLLEEALPEVKAIETEYGDVGPYRLSKEIQAALAKYASEGEGR